MTTLPPQPQPIYPLVQTNLRPVQAWSQYLPAMDTVLRTNVLGNGMPAGFVNKFRNGMMDVAQRGASGSSGSYTLDGWIVFPTGVSTTWSQQYNANLTANALRVNCASGMTGCDLIHRIESGIAAQFLANNKTAQPVTAQYTIYNGAGSPITPQFLTFFPNARDNFSGVTADLAAVNLQPIANGSIGTVAYTFTPSASCELGYTLVLRFGNQLNAATGFVDISYADIRATPGIATGLNNNPPPVEMRNVQAELAFCQRYYWKNVDNFFAAVRSANTFDNCMIYFPVTMRATPTLTLVWDDSTAGTVVRSGPGSCWFQSTNTNAGHYVTSVTASAEL